LPIYSACYECFGVIPRECPHQSESYRRCSCPIYVEGRVNWKFIRKSLGTRKWDEGVLLGRKIEADGFTSKLGQYTIEQALSLYLEDAQSRNLAGETLRSVNIILNRFLVPAFAGKRLPDITAATLTTWRTGWNLAPITALKRWEPGADNLFWWDSELDIDAWAVFFDIYGARIVFRTSFKKPKACCLSRKTTVHKANSSIFLVTWTTACHIYIVHVTNAYR